MLYRTNNIQQEKVDSEAKENSHTNEVIDITYKLNNKAGFLAGGNHMYFGYVPRLQFSLISLVLIAFVFDHVFKLLR